MDKTDNLARNIVEFMYFSNQLKLEMRHCWFKNGRRESVAEHSWQMGLLAISVTPYLSQTVHLETVLKMVLIHDLVEIEAKDIPVFEQSQNVKKEKFLRESAAIDNIKNKLPEKIGSEIHQLWHDYEEQLTIESKVVKALDKLEAFMAHNVSDINTFKDIEKQMYHEYRWLEQPCEVDPLLLEMATIINKDGIEKVAIEDSTD